ncbi:hypothetical protein J7F03_31100 [Streptomyces sp. ISL-43]|uniref:hypothetical protein n=1 Tax=Streptomyces sp. ISL-43 TaxID=2819183 RepID=UPI001BEC85D2|nr:hypothetical protein [Streptomyces sp. ISL-43]MBT2451434.1 hypothetical protein [Streptomyces sp. ISL-43]
MREIRANDRVRSAWTVSVVDFSAPGVSPQWLATEYVAAPWPGDWGHRHRHGPLGAPALWCLARELSAALVAVRAAGVVHRDKKTPPRSRRTEWYGEEARLAVGPRAVGQRWAWGSGGRRAAVGVGRRAEP